jgi:hypothetical protein
MPFLESCDPGHVLRGVLRRQIPSFFEEDQALLSNCHASFEFCASFFGCSNAALACANHIFLVGPLRL